MVFPQGATRSPLTLVTDKPGSIGIILPVHLWVKPDLYANPENVDFGTLRVEEVQRSDVTAPLTQTFFLKRRGDAFRITAIVCDSSAVDVTQSPAGPSNSFQIDVRLRAEALRRGSLDGKIRVMNHGSNVPGGSDSVERHPDLGGEASRRLAIRNQPPLANHLRRRRNPANPRYTSVRARARPLQTRRRLPGAA